MYWQLALAAVLLAIWLVAVLYVIVRWIYSDAPAGTPLPWQHRRSEAEVAERSPWKGPSILPSHELDTFLVKLTEAADLARASKVADGHSVLLAGLRRAERLQVDGEPWAEDLARRYREARERYAEQWGVARV